MEPSIPGQLDSATSSSLTASANEAVDSHLFKKMLVEQLPAVLQDPETTAAIANALRPLLAGGPSNGTTVEKPTALLAPLPSLLPPIAQTASASSAAPMAPDKYRPADAELKGFQLTHGDCVDGDGEQFQQMLPQLDQSEPSADLSERTLQVVDSEGAVAIMESHFTMTAWILAPTTSLPPGNKLRMFVCVLIGFVANLLQGLAVHAMVLVRVSGVVFRRCFSPQ